MDTRFLPAVCRGVTRPPSCRTVLCDAADALLERAQRAGAARAGVRGTDVIRLAQGVSMAADTGQDPAQADRMLALVLGGLLGPGAGMPGHSARVSP